MNHHHESVRSDALSAEETRLIALIAAIAIEQLIADTNQRPPIPQEGTAA